jgi:dTDP-4-amino-4,6-dideoxygalactose transaminase
MPRALVSLMRGLRARFPGLYGFARDMGTRFFPRRLGIYPRPLGNEMRAVSAVLHGPKWNMAYGKGLTHERLEAAFAGYIGVSHAIAVNTGGMALQLSMRALSLKPGDEVLLQVDTCSATAFAVMNAGCTPIFSDISSQTFMLPPNIGDLAGENSKAVIATHMWGNPEDMAMVTRVAAARDLAVIEDACLSLGARSNGRMAGAAGRVGVFSFGCLKPIQGGEGGMIVTQDEALARELRSLRHWGDRTIDYGVRDATQLSWNGRMSEIVAAVVHEQLKGYPAYLAQLRDAVADFAQFLEGIEGLAIVLGSAGAVQECAFTQVVLRFDERKLGLTKQQFRDALGARSIVTWHANFESINALSFFRNGTWRDWIVAGDIARAAASYHGEFPVCRGIYENSGVGISKAHFQTPSQIKTLKRQIAACLREVVHPS